MCLNLGHFFGTPFRQKSFLGQPCEALRALKEEHHTEGTEVTDVELECSDPKFIRSPNRHRRKLHFRLERFGNFDSFSMPVRTAASISSERASCGAERKRGSGQISGNRAIVDLLIVLATFEIFKLRSSGPRI
jgi:hypothetical protein